MLQILYNFANGQFIRNTKVPCGIKSTLKRFRLAYRIPTCLTIAVYTCTDCTTYVQYVYGYDIIVISLICLKLVFNTLMSYDIRYL